MTTKKFNLDNNFSILVEKTIEGKKVYLIDNVLNSNKLLATLDDSYHWFFPTPILQQEFFKIVKKYESIFMNNFYKPMEEIQEVTLHKQFECFRRRFNIKIVRTLNKIKHVI